MAWGCARYEKEKGEGNELVENFIMRTVRKFSIYRLPPKSWRVAFGVLLVVMLCSSASDKLLFMMKIYSLLCGMIGLKCSASFVVLALLSAPAFAGQHYWFEHLVENATAHQAPNDVQRAMISAEKERLLECQQEHGYSEKAMSNYFAAVPLGLGSKYQRTFLVFPSVSCLTYFGAHSVSFWVVAQNRHSTISTLMVASQDGVEILSSTSHGLRDLRTRYNKEKQTYRFNGSLYVKVTK